MSSVNLSPHLLKNLSVCSWCPLLPLLDLLLGLGLTLSWGIFCIYSLSLEEKPLRGKEKKIHIHIPALVSFPALSPLHFLLPYPVTKAPISYPVLSLVAIVLPFLGAIMPEKIQIKIFSYHREKIHLGYFQNIPCYTNRWTSLCLHACVFVCVIINFFEDFWSSRVTFFRYTLMYWFLQHIQKNIQLQIFFFVNRM